MSLIRVLLALLRVPTYLLLIVYLFAGLVISAADYGPTPVVSFFSDYGVGLLMAALVLAAWYIQGTALNDFADYEIDQINLKADKSRPLVTGAASKNTLLWIAICCSIVAAGLSAYWGTLGIGITAALLLLNFAYSIRPIRISRRGFWAPLLLPIAYVIYPLSLGNLITDWHITTINALLAGALYVHFFSRIVLKDFRDMKGDKKFGKKTVALQIGVQQTTRLAMTALGVGTVFISYCLYTIAPLSVVAVIITGALGASLLLKLQAAEIWQQQRPLVISFGRTTTGTIIIICLAYGFQISPGNTLQQLAAYTAALYLTISGARELRNFTSPKPKDS